MSADGTTPMARQAGEALVLAPASGGEYTRIDEVSVFAGYLEETVKEIEALASACDRPDLRGAADTLCVRMDALLDVIGGLRRFGPRFGSELARGSQCDLLNAQGEDAELIGFGHVAPDGSMVITHGADGAPISKN